MKVFCWLGWNTRAARYGPSAHLGAVAEPRPRAGWDAPGAARARSAPSQANAPSADHDPEPRKEPTRGRGTAGRRRVPPGVGRLAGGAQRTTAVTYASRQARARRRVRRRWAGSRIPARCSDANRKSPDRSPVKMRPVRLPPCAAGASPTTSDAGRGSPNPGTGRPSRARRRTGRPCRARPARATRPAVGTAGRRRPRRRSDRASVATAGQYGRRVKGRRDVLVRTRRSAAEAAEALGRNHEGVEGLDQPLHGPQWSASNPSGSSSVAEERRGLWPAGARAPLSHACHSSSTWGRERQATITVALARSRSPVLDQGVV